MGKIKKMSIVDTSLISEIENYKKNKITDIGKTEPTSSDQNPLSYSADKKKDNPYQTTFLQKRIYGLHKFLHGLITHRSSKNIAYDKLRKYNDALTSIMRINKFGNDLVPVDPDKGSGAHHHAGEVSFIISCVWFIMKNWEIL